MAATAIEERFWNISNKRAGKINVKRVVFCSILENPIKLHLSQIKKIGLEVK
jgi:hypothetical protein